MNNSQMVHMITRSPLRSGHSRRTPVRQSSWDRCLADDERYLELSLLLVMGCSLFYFGGGVVWHLIAG